MSKPFQFFRLKLFLILGIASLFFHSSIEAQEIIGIGTRYNDSFRQWVITTADDELKGELLMRWDFRDDWSEWDLQIGELTASIEQKWKDDPNLWEIRCEGVVVNAKTVWPGEFNRCKLTDGQHQFNWGTEFFNLRDHWQSNNGGRESMDVYTYWEGDPREWVVEDNLPDDVSMAMKIAMVFLALHYSTPRI